MNPFNPASQSVEFEVFLDPADRNWIARPDHFHSKVYPGQRATFPLRLRSLGSITEQQYEPPKLMVRADYLTDGRPTCRDRHVFIRAHAPYTGFGNSSSASAVASQALLRAGIVSPRKGAHLFRHTLATQMLGQGASLAQIGQLLRHQHPDTTRIYAKVDLAALRKLAPPWPGGAR